MADFKSIPASNNGTSDVMSFSSDTIGAMIQCKADNDGAPASGDTIDFYALVSLGDPDGAGAAEFPANEKHGEYLCTLDTNEQDADSKVVNCPIGNQIKVYAINNSSGRAITVSSTIWEIRRSNNPSELQVTWT